MPLLDHSGNAIPTQATATFDDNDLTFTIDDATGWPTGGANGGFWVTVNRDGANEERIFAESRSGTTITIPASGGRGQDGTAASTHLAGEPVEHTSAAEEWHEYNQHVFNVALDEHTQYMRTDGTRHDLTARHLLGTSIPAAAPINLAVNAANAAGVSTSGARSDHGHGVPRGTPVAIGTALAAGASGNFADAAHVHELGVGSIDTSSFFTAGVVDSAALGANAVIAGKVAAGAISETADLVDGIVTLVKLASEASTSYDPNFDLHNVNLGTGGVQYGRYFKLGRITAGIAGFALGTGGDVTGEIGFELPFTSVDRATGHASLDNHGWIVAGRANQAGTTFSGLGVIADNDGLARAFRTAGAGASWDAAVPFNWVANGVFQAFFFFEATA